MSDLCPACKRTLKPDARYCTGCGLEVRMPCPACDRHLISLVRLDPTASAWCENRGAALYACENCGRWLLPGTRCCPDPNCARRALPHQPQHTGRRWDGRGSGVQWIWPVRWESRHPQHVPPEVRVWSGIDPVYAALVAFGNLLLWAGTRLVSLDDQAFWKETSARATAPPETQTVSKPRLDVLPGAARPAANLPFEDRISVVGAAAVLAAERGFYRVSLHDRSDCDPLEIGTPLAQAADPMCWVGWSEQSGVPLLYAAPAAPSWDALAPVRIETPANAAIAPAGRIVLRDRIACWPGKEGAVWQLDCETGCVRQVVEPGEPLKTLWMEADGPRTVRAAERTGQISIGMTAPSQGRHLYMAPAGQGPLRGVYSSGQNLVIVGETVRSFDMRSDESRSLVQRPPGQWIAGALVDASDGTARLLVLVKESGFARLYVLQYYSGVLQLLWEEEGIEPLALLPVAGGLTIAHSRGVVRLMEVLP